MKKIAFFYVVTIFFCLQIVAADKITFTATAPDAVAVGDQFRLSYTVNTKNVKDFRVPAIKGFDVLMGPSRSYSMQSTNGQTSETLTYTYILMATAEGSFTIPGATLRAGGNPMISNSVHINVLPADQKTTSSNSHRGASKSSNHSSSSKSLSIDDLFITASASKTTVYDQEAFLLTYKIYTLVDLRGFDNVRLPDFKGFHSQEIEMPNDRRWSLEHYKGRNYQTTIYRQFVLFPQQTGKLVIDSAQFDASVAKPVQVNDPFEAFFNGGASYVEIKKQLNTPKLVINSKELPNNKPENFSGGVGEFNISSSISSSHVKINDAITLKIVISGIGNLKLISTPEVKFPEDFEVYDPKINNNFKPTNTGLSGSQIIEYLAIPRSAGKFKIPAIKFSYFDIISHSYKVLATEDYTLQVDKGMGNATQTVANFTNKEDLKVLNEDIRYIKQNDVTLSPNGDFFFGKIQYILFYIVPTLFFILFSIGYRKRIALNSNIALVRTKRANKVAVKRMKIAKKLLEENKKDAFYDEVLKALWGFISDKLNIPLSLLSKDNIEDKLKENGVDESLIQEFLSALKDCEFARFAPGNDNQAMDSVYASSLAVIEKMENSIKH